LLINGVGGRKGTIPSTFRETPAIQSLRTKTTSERRSSHTLRNNWPAIKPGTKSFETVTGFARGECTIEKSNRTSATANSISNLVGYQAPTLSESPHRFSELIDDWALERDPKRKTRDEFESKVTKLVATVPVVWTASGANKQRPVAG
jgi:hypothetical protein